MAGRTGTSVGVAVTITILGITALSLFITTVVFLSKWQAVVKELNQTREDNRDFVTESERARDDIRTTLGAARGEGMSLVGYLMDQQSKTMDRVTGSARDNFANLQSQLDGLVDEATPVLRAVRNRDQRIEALESELDQAEASLRKALEDLQNENESKRQLIQAHEETVARLQEELEQYRLEVQEYRSDVADARVMMDETIDQERAEASAEKSDLENRISELQREILNLQEQLSRLREDTAPDRLTAAPEEALIDGRVLDVYPANNEVIINRGRQDKIVLGMLFAVYDSGARIRPNEAGEYPPGKAGVEVIGIDEATSRCRIVTEIAGSPVVAGDVITNPVYDAEKVYRFVVYGNFDSDGDGIATAREAKDIAALIESWGGRVDEEIGGNTDFLVLGSKPVLPPEPGGNVPIEVIRNWLRLQDVVKRYDDLLEQARSTSIPVLNENRLRTLVGM